MNSKIPKKPTLVKTEYFRKYASRVRLHPTLHKVELNLLEEFV